jgi:hypothetical protein
MVESGVDVMITIFCDFCQFSAKKWRFLKNQYYDQIFGIIWLCYESKTPIFSQFFGENILKIITSVPGKN